MAKTYGYDQYQECLASKEVDAVYITLPNDMHKEFAVRAARMGVNPRNPSEKVQIRAATVPKFSAGSVLKKAVN